MTLTFYRNKQTVCDSFPFQQLITIPDFSQCVWEKKNYVHFAMTSTRVLELSSENVISAKTKVGSVGLACAHI